MRSYLPEVRILLSDLRHLVHWHDQLGPTDIQRAEATIAHVTQLIAPAPVNNGADSPISAAASPVAGRLVTEAQQFLAGYAAMPTASMADHLVQLLTVIDAEATKRARESFTRTLLSMLAGEGGHG